MRHCPRCSGQIVIDGAVVPDYDVFISHSSKDKQTADAVVAALESAKIRCWVAPRDIAPGARWGSAIIDAIANSRVMVLIYSGHANSSEQVFREVERAVARGVVIVPLRIDPTPLSKDMEYFISANHWLDALTSPLERHLTTLVRTVHALVARDDRPASDKTDKAQASLATPAPLAPDYRKRSRLRLTLVLISLMLGVGAAAWRYGPWHKRVAGSGMSQASNDAAQTAAVDRIATNSLGMKFIHISAGELMMGSPETEISRATDETLHRVTIERPFYIGMYHVTRGQFAAFVQGRNYQTFAEKANDALTWRNPGFPQTDDHPVVCVTWNDAAEFIAWLNAKERTLGHHYRFATEAEWEYACRAGTSTIFNTGDTEEALTQGGWSSENSDDGTHPVGSKAPNKWGLYDMHGSAWQWCSDPYGPYGGEANPMSRVLRGGSWNDPAQNCRAATRRWNEFDDHYPDVGFRIAMDP
jgi:formylglycine-generating enzyme required for sulfatase activity